ncbi:MAG TPA: hypothetical protein VGN93_04600 [Shinella sp.]|uniref:hypothetical protein n=1 Tax=Shinella sp. TaxID=1870904 RepID=UPI002E0E298B|nr:hypothetical protein [Shinella sp.]
MNDENRACGAQPEAPENEQTVRMDGFFIKLELWQYTDFKWGILRCFARLQRLRGKGAARRCAFNDCGAKNPQRDFKGFTNV